MEIAFFTDSYRPTHDGVAHVVSALARSMASMGHGVRVFAPHPVKGAAPTTEDDEGVPVVRLRSVPVPYYGEYRWAVFPFGELRRTDWREGIDVIHLHTPGILGSAAFLTARRYDKPLVGTFHTNVWAMRGSFPDTAITRLFFRAAWWYTLGTYWRCDATTAPTPEAARILAEAIQKPLSRPVEVVPNGIEIERFRPGVAVPDWRARCGLPAGPMITFLGRLTVDKGVHRFLDAVEALAKDRPVTAVVGGSGPEEPRVRERLRTGALSGIARYVGPVSEEEKPSLLAQSELFVLPSTSDTSSVSLLEAMASGVACVASDRGGLPAIVKDGRTGRTAPLDPPAALPRVIGELLDDRSERVRLGAAARQYVVQQASIDSMARRFISLYEVLMSGPDRNGRQPPRRAGSARPLRPEPG